MEKIKHNTPCYYIIWHERVINMKVPVFYPAGHTEALGYAVLELKRKGCIFTDRPDRSVTHLLLPAPAFDSDGSLKGGGILHDILKPLSPEVTVLGGNLMHPALEGYKTADLLRDPLYLAENADITAHCALKLAMSKLPVTLRGCHVLVIGWGRIGKCLARLLKQLGAIVTVAARKEADRAMLLALGYDIEDTTGLSYTLLRYRVIFNTAPFMVLPKEAMQYCREDCLKIDLASAQGMEAEDVIWARGLPNKDAPESSGALIARSVLRLSS